MDTYCLSWETPKAVCISGDRTHLLNLLDHRQYVKVIMSRLQDFHHENYQMVMVSESVSFPSSPIVKLFGKAGIHGCHLRETHQ